MPNILTSPQRRVAAEMGRGFSKADIAELTPRQISRMSEDDLARVIRTVRMSFLQDDVLDQLPCLDRRALERLAYLARRTCRNQGY